MSDTDQSRVTTGDLIRRLILAHLSSDEENFESAVRDLIGEERRKNHTIFAKDLERLLTSGNGQRSPRTESLTRLPGRGELPRDKDRAADLVEIIEPIRSVEDLVINERTRADIDRLINENRSAELLHAHGLKPSMRILFCGPPGCGKTVTAEAVANALYLPLVLVRFDAVISSYLGETAANLRRVFEYARGRPMVLFFDEFDAIGKRRDDAQEHGELKRVVNSFLQMLDRFRGDTLTIAATNHDRLLDPAIWRRFDSIVYFPLPTVEEIEQLLTRLWRQTPMVSMGRVPLIAESLVGLSHADVERVAVDSIKAMVLSNRRQLDFGEIQAIATRERSRVTLSSPESSSFEDQSKSRSRTGRRRH
jgi:SpoVK/Ycf46/Vps4 family AAA+-type ATPase